MTDPSPDAQRLLDESYESDLTEEESERLLLLCGHGIGPELSPAALWSSQMPEPNEIKLTSGEEIIRITPTGFHYKDQLIEDAGECHRLLVGFLRRTMPEADWQHAQ